MLACLMSQISLLKYRLVVSQGSTIVSLATSREIALTCCSSISHLFTSSESSPLTSPCSKSTTGTSRYLPSALPFPLTGDLLSLLRSTFSFRPVPANTRSRSAYTHSANPYESLNSNRPTRTSPLTLSTKALLLPTSPTSIPHLSPVPSTTRTLSSRSSKSASRRLKVPLSSSRASMRAGEVDVEEEAIRS